MQKKSGPPRVSIVTCSYNHAPYAAACAASVLAQGISDWEWLIHDDGSTDGTYEFFAGLNDPRIRVTRGPHLGHDQVMERKNALLAQCTGQWIALLDSDDTWEPSRLIRQLEAVSQRECVLVHGDIWLINAAGEKKCRLAPHTDPAVLTNSPIGAAALEAVVVLNFPIYSTTALILRSALLKIGGFRSGAALWDFSTFLEISLTGPFLYLPEATVCWRRHSGQTTMMSGRIPRQYQANLERARQFVLANEAVLKSAGLQEDFLQERQQRVLRRAAFAEDLIRANALLDIGAWKEARGLFWGHLTKRRAEKSASGQTYYLAALIGLFSGLLRVRGTVWASALKKMIVRWLPGLP